MSSTQPGNIPPPIYHYASSKPLPEQPAPNPIPPLPPPPIHRFSFPLILGIGLVVICCFGAALVGGGWVLFRDKISPIVEDSDLPDSFEETAIVELPTEFPESTAQDELVEPTAEMIEPVTVPIEPTNQRSAPQANMTFDRVRFYLAPSIAYGISGEIIPASDGEELAYFAIYPEYIQIELSGYTLQNTFHQAQIYVYPVLAYASINESASRTIGELRKILAERVVSGADENLPFLPIWPAAQYMHVQVKDFDFQNGSGVRYLTQYGQDAYPINNDNLFYTYQGLTDDGIYYVSAVLPVSHPDLPFADNIEIDQGFYDGFESYLQNMVITMNAWEADTYSPDLGVLDELISSVEITP